MPTPKWEKAAEQADPLADRLLDKIKASKWTAAILGGIVAAGCIGMIFAWVVG